MHHLFHDTAAQLARESGFCQRARKLTGPVFAQSLVFSFLQNPDATLDDFADTAELLLEESVTGQAFDKRFTPAAANFLQHLFVEAFNQSFNSLRPRLLPVLRRFAGVFLRDATLVSPPAALAPFWPGRGGRQAPHGRAAAVKLVFEAEVTTGELTEVSLLAGLDNEQTAAVAHKPLPAGALLLEDLGFFSGERLQGYSDQWVYVLSRVPAWTAFFDEKGRRLDLVKLLRQSAGWYLERRVRILHSRKLSVRLLAARLPEAEAKARRRRVRREAEARGRTVSQKKLELCAWNVLVTNAPPGVLSLEEALTVRRLRWQMETTFQKLRAHLGLETKRGWCRETVLRAAPYLFGLYTVVAVWFAALPEAKRQGEVRWPGKQGVTFSDAFATVRRWLWSEWVLPEAHGGAAVEKLPDPLREIILCALAAAA
jgi:hypothetical protein